MHIGSTPESNFLNTLDTAVMESQRTFIPVKGGTYGQFVSYCDEESDEPDDPSELGDLYVLPDPNEVDDPEECVELNGPADSREQEEEDISVCTENIGKKFNTIFKAV